MSLDLSDCLAYLKSVFPQVDENQSLHEAVRTGVLLCNLAKRIDPGIQAKADTRNIVFVHGSNIQIFVDFCQRIGVPQEALPAPLAVVNNEPGAMKKLAICLRHVEKACKVDAAAVEAPHQADQAEQQVRGQKVQSQIEVCKNWLASIFPDLDVSVPFCDVVQSGVVLCELVNKVQPEYVGKIDTRATPFVYAANLQHFVDYCQHIKIPQQFLFNPSDVAKKNADAVHNLATCLMFFASAHRIGNWEGQLVKVEGPQESVQPAVLAAQPPREATRAAVEAVEAVEVVEAAPEAQKPKDKEKKHKDKEKEKEKKPKIEGEKSKLEGEKTKDAGQKESKEKKIDGDATKEAKKKKKDKTESGAEKEGSRKKEKPAQEAGS